MMESVQYVVVGAGISGLSVAYGLHRRNADVLLLEAASTVGGVMQSEQTAEGYVLEHGPNTVVSNDPDLWQAFADLGIANERLVAGHAGSKRYILFNGAPEPIPMSPGALLRSPLLSTAAKWRVLAEPFLPRAVTPDESVINFFSRRLGLEPAQNLVDPFVSGVYAGNPRELSMRAAFPRLWEAEQRHGSIIRGMLAGSGAQKSKPKGKRELFGFQCGLTTWPQAIVRALGAERVWLNTQALRLQPVDGKWRLTVLRAGRETVIPASYVILAVPAYVVADLVADLDALVSQALRTIPYPPMAVVHLGYRRADIAHPLDGFGMLCPSKERRMILGTLWPSTLFPGRAPANTVLTTVFVGGASNPAVALQEDDALVNTVHGEQQALLGARSAPIMSRVIRWPRAIPQYVAGHVKCLAAIERLEAVWPTLRLAGNYRNGVSTIQCWKDGQELAARLPGAVRIAQPVMEQTHGQGL
jgi:oxygen-dependent protoporphyrinogen oxidase